MSLLHFGTDSSKLKQTLPDITKALVAILNTVAGDAVKIAAINAISAHADSKIEGVTVSDCTFTGK